MTRIAALVLLISLIASRLTGPVTPTEGTVVLATPATVPADVSRAVPISLTIRNVGVEADRLLGGHTPVAARVEAHQT
ncbi:MAG: copper chaperone PCu(A)C, partial [Thermomicrobiales bacterium]